MQVQMKNGLSRTAAVVEHSAVASEQILFFRKLRSDQLQLAQQRLVICGRVLQRSKVFSRADQNVRRRLRTDVFKSKTIFVIVDKLCRNLFCTDFAKEAILAHLVAPEFTPSSRRRTVGLKPSFSRSFSPKSCAASSPEIFPTRTR